MGLRTELRTRILVEMIEDVLESGVDCMTLILDAHTTKILTSCLRTSDLVSQGVLSLQYIHRIREPLRDFAAVYFITPTLESISQLLWDFQKSSNNSDPLNAGLIRGGILPCRQGQPKSPMYKNAYVFFTQPPETNEQMLLQLSDIKPYLRRLRDLSLGFTTYESRVFTTSQPNALRIMASSTADTLAESYRETAKKLASLCTALREDPAVRYLGFSPHSKTIAEAFSSHWSDYKRQLSNRGGFSSRTRGCLLILDRSVDMIAPLLHEFTYQAMVHDICAVQGEQVLINYPGPKGNYDREANTLLLNESEDSVWEANRHEHIGVVGANLPREMSQFKKNNKMAQLENERAKAEKKGRDFNISTKQMSSALSDFGTFAKTSTLLTKHLSLSQECLSKTEKANLTPLASLEQDIVTAFNEDGKSISKADAITGFRRMIDDIPYEEGIRLLLLLILSRGGMDQSTFSTMIRKLPNFTSTIFSSHRSFGANVTNSSYVPVKMEDERIREGKRRAVSLQLMRFVPEVWRICRKLATNSLPDTDFPYLTSKDQTIDQDRIASQSNKRETRSIRRRDQNTGRVVAVQEQTLPYLIIYIAGGVTFSEMRSLYEIQKEFQSTVNLIIGGPEILNPRAYLKQLSGETWEEYFSKVNRPLGGFLEIVTDPLMAAAEKSEKFGGKSDGKKGTDEYNIDMRNQSDDEERKDKKDRSGAKNKDRHREKGSRDKGDRGDKSARGDRRRKKNSDIQEMDDFSDDE